MPKILVVEDDRRMLRLLSMTVPEGYELEQATDGEEAVRLVAESLPDLVLLDINLPRVNGFEVLNRLRESGALSATRVIAVTARSDEADRDSAMRLGAKKYLTKPFSPLRLLGIMSDLLGEPASYDDEGPRRT